MNDEINNEESVEIDNKLVGINHCSLYFLRRYNRR